MKRAVSRVCAAVLLAAAAGAADSDTRSVQSEFDRCAAVMERVEREMRRYEESVKRLMRTAEETPRSVPREVTQDLGNLEGRIEYFRRRIDRAAAQADRIRGDLKGVKGPTCPSCVSSSVNLYCRNGERLLAEIGDYASRASALQGRLRSMPGGTAADTASSAGDTSFAARRGLIEEAIAAKGPLLDSCAVDAGRTLWAQCRTSLRAADSLHAAGSVEQSRRMLGLAGMLLEKALDKCGGP
jgi:hypothetical protein